jgi:outer membrane protein TolC
MNDHRPWGRLALATALALSWASRAEEIVAEPPRPRPTTGVTLADFLDKTSAEREERSARIIEEALASTDKIGTWRQLEHKKLVRMPANQAALEALKKNLSVEISQHDAERIRRAVLEAEAVFNPVLGLSVKYDERDTFDRKLVGTVIRPAFDAKNDADNANGEITLDPIARQLVKESTGLDIVAIRLTPFSRGEFPRDDVTRAGIPHPKILASRNQPNGPTQTFNYTASLQQQLPWGPRFDISAVTTDRDVFYDNRGNTFGASWATNLLFNLEVPVGRNFGPYAVFNTQLKLRQKESESAFWALNTTINSTLLTVDLTYLDLVQALENLLVQIDNRQLVERQSQHTQRLYDQNLATTYDKAQIDALLEGARAQEELAKNAYIVASNRLAELIEYSGKAVRNNIYMPSGYGPWLEQSLELDTDGALKTALARRPELMFAQVNYEAREIGRKGAEVDARPDVKLNASVQSRQDGTVYGYKSYGESLGAISDPDNFRQSYGVSYRYPWGNRAVKARLAQAEGFVQVAAMDKRATHNDVARDVHNALSNLETARVRVQREEQRLAAAHAAYNSIARLWESDLVNVNELIINITNLLNAKLDKIRATIDNKRAESNLLQAQGIIATHYAGMVAGNPLERWRIRQLSEKGDLQYFLR